MHSSRSWEACKVCCLVCVCVSSVCVCVRACGAFASECVRTPHQGPVRNSQQPEDPTAAGHGTQPGTDSAPRACCRADDPITAAIMRAQKRMQNLNIINDHHNYGQEDADGDPKAGSSGTAARGVHRWAALLACRWAALLACCLHAGGLRCLLAACMQVGCAACLLLACRWAALLACCMHAGGLRCLHAGGCVAACVQVGGFVFCLHAGGLRCLLAGLCTFNLQSPPACSLDLYS